MTLIKTEKIDGSRAKITFTIPAETFNAEVTAIFKKQAVKITVPGFRKGKAPRSIVEKMYGKGVFFEDALNNLLPAAYEAALKESELDSVGARPNFDIEEISDEGVVTVTADLAIKPEVEIANYLGMSATKADATVSAEMVNEEIEAVRKRNARVVTVSDRAAKLDDTALIDYLGSVDGVPFEGGKGEKYPLALGSGSFIPGFEEQVAGHKVGETFDVNVTFPTEYHAEELAGKEAVFSVTLHELKESQLPDLDDEFAKDVSTYDTFAEYHDSVEKKLVEKADAAAESEFEGQLMDQLIDNLKADIPEEMIEIETDNFVRDTESRLRMQGMDLPTYFKYTGMKLEDLREQMRPQAERQVKGRLALEKIVELEKLEVADDEVETEYNKLSETYNMSVDEIKKMVDPSSLGKDLLVKKAVSLVKGSAKVVPPEAEKPAKKAPAKKKTTTEEV